MIENRILPGNSLDILKTLPEQSVDCCVTSPPYYLMRDYGGIEGQIGLEDTPEEYIKKLVSVFKEVKRVLKDTGTLWVVIGDSYAGSRKGFQGKHLYGYKNKESPQKAFLDENIVAKTLIGIPWRFALAMQEGWLLRQDIIWAKTNPMPEPYKDRFCRSHEYIFLFSKQQEYYFNHKNALEDSIVYGRQEKLLKRRGYALKTGDHGLRPQCHGEAIETAATRTMRDVWFVSTEASEEKHYAMFPQRIIMPCILCGCPENGVVLDPFMGSGTTAAVAGKHFRKYIGIEINPEYINIAERRIARERGLFDSLCGNYKTGERS
jgi:DNA modification methylase